MGYLTPAPDERPHYCSRPAAFRVGARWQCDDCGVIYRVESVRDRGVSQLEWVKE